MPPKPLGIHQMLQLGNTKTLETYRDAEILGPNKNDIARSTSNEFHLLNDINKLNIHQLSLLNFISDSI